MRLKFGSCDLAADSAGRNSDQGIVPYALVFSGVAACHHVELVILLAKPYRSCDRRAILAKGDQRHVLLTVNLGRDRHDVIISTDKADVLAGGLGSLEATSIARKYTVVLKARHAQMDARSSQAQKT